MKGLERTPDGRCRIGSQFMIWVGDLEYKVRRYVSRKIVGTNKIVAEPVFVFSPVPVMSL